MRLHGQSWLTSHSRLTIVASIVSLRKSRNDKKTRKNTLYVLFFFFFGRWDRGAERGREEEWRSSVPWSHPSLLIAIDKTSSSFQSYRFDNQEKYPVKLSIIFFFSFPYSFIFLLTTSYILYTPKFISVKVPSWYKHSDQSTWAFLIKINKCFLEKKNWIKN